MGRRVSGVHAATVSRAVLGRKDERRACKITLCTSQLRLRPLPENLQSLPLHSPTFEKSSTPIQTVFKKLCSFSSSCLPRPRFTSIHVLHSRAAGKVGNSNFLKVKSSGRKFRIHDFSSELTQETQLLTSNRTLTLFDQLVWGFFTHTLFPFLFLLFPPFIIPSSPSPTLSR